MKTTSVITRILCACATAALYFSLPGVVGMAQTATPSDTVRLVPNNDPEWNRPNGRGQQVISLTNADVARAERLIAEGRSSEAVDILEPAWRADPRDELIANSLKKALRILKNYDGLIAVVRRQLDDRRNDPQLMSELADAYFGLEEVDSAKAVLTRLVDIDRSDAARHEAAAQAYTRHARYADGMAVYRQARVDLRDSLIFAEHLARLLEARREYEGAVGEYFRWLAAKPALADQVQRRITNLVRVPGAVPQVTAALRKIVIESADHEYAHRLYGDLLFESGLIDSAFAEYRRADKLSDTPGEHRLFGIGRALEVDELRIARDEAIAFLSDYPDHPRRFDVRFQRAKAELGLGQPDTAIAILQEISRQIPDPREQMRFALEIGMIYWRYTEHVDSARVWFERVVALGGDRTPGGARAYMALADIYVYHGDLTQADTIYARLTRPPRELQEELDFRKAEIRFLSGDFGGAQAQLKELIKRYPRGLFVNDAINLSLIITDGNDAMGWSLKRYAEALLSLKKRQADTAIAVFAVLSSDSANALADDAQFAIATVEAMNERYAAAIDALDSLIAKFPESPHVPRAWVARGDILAGKLNDREKARASYQTVLTNFKESPVVEEARHHLQQLGVP